MSKQTTRPTPFGVCDRNEAPLFSVQPGILIEHALEHASCVLGTARVLTLAAQDLCTEHQSYLNWASLQLAETGLALVEACIDGLQADASTQ
ncbi:MULTISPECIES: DUF3077 domain-containing protein [Pseudomonas]|jgi:hypothetical protein|uniref:DUF3077 domain-containing protein n=1 Tax=Pseudomonas fluorescens TaxID=294 RepID=A0A109KMH0_PSEFL|nr:MULTISPECIES: DUF3077 domain-containing protein [Pseudomonas]KRC91362.1 hypothetical protein ASE33_08955 [Pseudomonas sp. Root9]KWV71887.1 hypothetical protein PFL603g_04428 [Pseudomonas fluorescens]